MWGRGGLLVQRIEQRLLLVPVALEPRRRHGFSHEGLLKAFKGLLKAFEGVEKSSKGLLKASKGFPEPGQAPSPGEGQSPPPTF